MSSQHDSPPESVHELLPSLAATAANLNEASEKLSQLIERFDHALQRLNLGVSAWVTLQRGEEVDGSVVRFWFEQLGYGRMGRKWGLTLRRVEGLEGALESTEEEKWFFNDAPRSLRIMAVPKIPELLQKLDREAREMVEQVSTSISSAAPLVQAIELSAKPQRSVKKKLGGRS